MFPEMQVQFFSIKTLKIHYYIISLTAFSGKKHTPAVLSVTTHFHLVHVHDIW